MVDRQQHWEGIYSGKPAGQVSWFQPHAGFGAAFRLLGHEIEVHHTPTGKEQDLFIVIACESDHA